MDLLVTILSLLLSLLPMKETADKRTVQIPPICFRVDKTVYDPDYLGNRASVDSLVRLVEKVGEENVESIHVVAYASPEGWLWQQDPVRRGFRGRCAEWQEWLRWHGRRCLLHECAEGQVGI